jgi:hypothetical protein
MAKRRTKVAVAVAIAISTIITIALIANAHSTSEPRYHGKTLSYWLLGEHDGTDIYEVDQAITTIGTNNIKLLLHWFQEPEPAAQPPWYRRLAEAVQTNVPLIRITKSDTPKPPRREIAQAVFQQYPTVARTCIPAFIEMFNHKDNSVRTTAAMVLVGTGKDAVQSLVAALSHENLTNRCLAAFTLGNIGEDAKPAIPKLETMLTDKSPYARLAFAEALAQLDADPQAFVPALIECLRDGDQRTRFFASRDLGNLRNRAAFAVPNLLELLSSSTNTDQRVAIYNAIVDIDYNAATEISTNLFPERRGRR